MTTNREITLDDLRDPNFVFVDPDQCPIDSHCELGPDHGKRLCGRDGWIDRWK